MSEILPGVRVAALQPLMGAQAGVMNVCLLIDRGGVTVVDAGLPGSAPAILDELRQAGLAPAAVRRVIITHHHIDHVGGLADLVAATGAEVWAHRDDAPTIEGTVPRPGLPPERVAAMLEAVPVEQREAAAERMRTMREVTPVPVDLRLVGGEELEMLGGVRVVHSPGHTAGHLCLFLPALALLIAGDLMRLEDGAIRESPSGYAADAALSLASVRQVAALDFTAFVGYHGGYVVAGAGALLAGSLAAPAGAA
jgi:glyoxylase-like metal-dependent hydrolase (beta-lactamase superfamily II)